MHFYGLSDRQVLDVPINRFWLLEKNIARLEALRDLRSLNVAAGASSGQGYQELQGSLHRELGPVVVAPPKIDRKGLESLKNMSQGVLR